MPNDKEIIIVDSGGIKATATRLASAIKELDAIMVVVPQPGFIVNVRSIDYADIYAKPICEVKSQTEIWCNKWDKKIKRKL